MRIIKTVLFIIFFIAVGCSQTQLIKARWDKNTEPDMDHYDLFLYQLPDSGLFWLPGINWPVDTLQDVYAGSYHYQYLLATVGHVFGGVDSMYFEWEQSLNNMWIRAYICAIDSAGNRSFLTPSMNVLYLPDEMPPNKVRNFKF